MSLILPLSFILSSLLYTCLSSVVALHSLLCTCCTLHFFYSSFCTPCPFLLAFYLSWSIPCCLFVGVFLFLSFIRIISSQFFLRCIFVANFVAFFSLSSHCHCFSSLTFSQFFLRCIFVAMFCHRLFIALFSLNSLFVSIFAFFLLQFLCDLLFIAFSLLCFHHHLFLSAFGFPLFPEVFLLPFLVVFSLSSSSLSFHESLLVLL